MSSDLAADVLLMYANEAQGSSHLLFILNGLDQASADSPRSASRDSDIFDFHRPLSITHIVRSKTSLMK